LNRRLPTWYALAAAGLGLALVAGCDYSPPGRAPTPKGRREAPDLPRTASPGTGSASKGLSSRRTDEERKAILDSSMTLIERAALQPGGENFAQAVKKLNQYFEGTDSTEYQLESASRQFLAAQLDPASINQFQSNQFRLPDTRHIEDCMMY
jgi:hypothetical protein